MTIMDLLGNAGHDRLVNSVLQKSEKMFQQQRLEIIFINWVILKLKFSSIILCAIIKCSNLGCNISDCSIEQVGFERPIIYFFK